MSPKARLELARRAAEVDRLPKFREYADAWIASRRNSKGEPLRPTTRDKYLSSLRVHIYPTFGDIPMDEITRAAVRSWHESLDAGPVTKAHVYTTLRTILNTAVMDDELLDKNPAYLRGAGVRSSRRQVKPASLDELAIMVGAMPERRRLLLLLVPRPPAFALRASFRACDGKAAERRQTGRLSSDANAASVRPGRRAAGEGWWPGY